MFGTQARRTNLTSLPLVLTTLLLVAGFFILPVKSALANATLQTLPLSQDWTDANLITANDDWSGVPGIIGYLGDYTTASPTGVDPRTLLSDYSTLTVDVIANQTNTGITNGGVAEFEITDPVVALQGSGAADAPFLLIHIRTSHMRNIRVQYNVRDIDSSTDNAIQPVALHYRVGSSGGFTNLPGGYIADATTGPNLATLVTPIDVTLPAAANNQTQVQLRIMTTNAVGSDEWVGIDDLQITGEVIPELIISKDAPEIVLPGETYTYTLSLDNAIQMTATNVNITDTLPANTTFVNASDGGVFAGGVISWTVPSMANGTVVNRSYRVIATTSAGLVITNDDYRAHASNWVTATIGSAVNTYVTPLDVSITKIAPDFAIGGESLDYVIRLDFVGVITASHVVVTDTLPLNVTYVSDTSGVIPSFPSTGVVVWDFGDVPTTTNSLTYTLVAAPAVTILSNSTITNQVEISTDTVGDPLANNTSQAQTTIYQIVPIATARAGSVGQIFAVEGQVTFLPGTYSANDWGLQDASGGIIGYFYPPPDVEYGDYVRLVAGRLDYSNQEEIGSPFLFFANLGPGSEVTPVDTDTGVITSGVTEGWLVHIEGIVSDLGICSPTANYTFYVDDGSGAARVYMDRDVGIDVCAMGAANGKYIKINGFSSQFGSNYEVKPRQVSDIDVDANYPAITKDAPSTVAPGDVFTYTIIVENKLGYTLTNVTVVDNLPGNVSSDEGSTIIRSLGTLEDRTETSVSFPVTATEQVTVVLNNSYYISATEFTTPTYGAVATTFVVSGSLQIHDIQGAGHASPFVGQRVDGIRGVVTMRISSGFYMQDTTPDADPDTSEGIFVYTTNVVQVGDVVSLNGLVVEYNGMTELSGITGLTTYANGIIVDPTPVSLPVPVGTDLEPYESMLVVFPQTLTVAQNYFQGRYGQVTLSVGRMYNPTNGNGLGDTMEYNLRRMIILDDALTSQNPNPIPYIGQDNTLRAGDTVAGVIGVVDYGLITNDSVTRFYRLQPTEVPTFTRVNERTAAPEDVGGSVKVASMNVLNYFNGDGQGGGFPTSRGATTYEEFVRQRMKIITATVAINADIVGLMEIENDGDGTYSAIQDLVNGLNAETAPGTYAFIIEPAPGTDEIKVALIYKPGVVTPVGATINYQVTDHPVYGTLYDRPPLVQQFSVNATGQSFLVIVNHFKSKGSCPASPTDPDAEYGQGCWNVKRIAQANGLLDLIIDLTAATGESDAMIIGDLNSYGEEDPILALTAGGMVNELASRVPAVERYSYIFDGQSGYLDQALVTASLDEQVSGATIWHINADEPEIINYILANKSQDLYTTTPYRSSDHDPVFVGLNLRPATLVVTQTVTPNTGVDLGGVVTYTLMMANQADVTAFGIVVTDVLPVEMTFGGWVVQGGAYIVGDEGRWDGDLPAGGLLTVIFTASLGLDPVYYGDTITNVVHFTSVNDGSGSFTASFNVLDAPVLSINKSVEFSNEPPIPGGTITYTVTVANAGPSAALDVHVSDALPAEVVGVSVDLTVTILAESVYEVIVPALLVNDYALYGATITNTATYECRGIGSGTAEITFDVVEAPELSIVKTVELSRDPVQPGDPITYTITLSNAGPADAMGVHVIDVLPDEVIGADVDITVTVPAGDEYSLVLPVTLSPEVAYDAMVTNTAAFTYMGAVTGQDNVSFTVAGAPELAVEKTVELTRLPAQPGDVITYTITITNLGLSDAVDVHIIDVLPAYVVGVSVDVSVTIPAERVYEIVVPARVAANAPNGASVTNTVYVYHPSGGVSASISFDVMAWIRVYLPLVYHSTP
jgi:uncharacterized repeat protein (TIGR01451 family)